MSVLESLYVGVFGIAVVFIVLVGLSLLLRLQAAMFGRSARRRVTMAVPEEAPALAAPDVPVLIVEEPLKLIGVDEKTAALLMAIVCEEMGCEPEELYFKSIRALDQAGEGAKR